jgi:hypothetical protein
VRAGRVVVSNGPLLDLEVNGAGPGATLDAAVAAGRARVLFHRPISKLEIVLNGQVVASRPGDGAATELELPFRLDVPGSAWIAARAEAAHLQGEPEIRAHTNPVYVLRGGKPVRVEAARRAVVEKWERQAEYYRSDALEFADAARRRELLDGVGHALETLRR